jgi:Holliday junction resolvase-like predicted endonuclease
MFHATGPTSAARKKVISICGGSATSWWRGTSARHGDKDVLCFIEVKTRTTHDVKPAESAVDREKRRALRKVIRDYLQSLPASQSPEPPPWRFDVLTVYYELPSSAPDEGNRDLGRLRRDLSAVHPTFELFQNAALSA